MERKLFLKNGLAALGIAFVAPLAGACKKDADTTASTGEDVTNTGTGSGTCTVAPSETEGPFPTKQPSSYNANDNIFSDDSAGLEMSTVTGNLTDGFALAIKLNVS